MPDIAHNHKNVQKNQIEQEIEQKTTQTDISRQDIARVKRPLWCIIAHNIVIYTVQKRPSQDADFGTETELQ